MGTSIKARQGEPSRKRNKQPIREAGKEVLGRVEVEVGRENVHDR